MRASGPMWCGDSKIFIGVHVISLGSRPVRMIGNLVAGSDDMGYMHPAESCPPRGIFKNEAVGVVTGAGTPETHRAA